MSIKTTPKCLQVTFTDIAPKPVTFSELPVNSVFTVPDDDRVYIRTHKLTVGVTECVTNSIGLTGSSAGRHYNFESISLVVPLNATLTVSK